MGLKDKILFKLEQDNNARIAATLKGLLPSDVDISLARVKCSESDFQHSALKFEIEGEVGLFHRCRQMWYLEAENLPRNPLPLLDPINPHVASMQIASVIMEDMN